MGTTRGPGIEDGVALLAYGASAAVTIGHAASEDGVFGCTADTTEAVLAAMNYGYPVLAAGALTVVVALVLDRRWPDRRAGFVVAAALCGAALAAVRATRSTPWSMCDAFDGFASRYFGTMALVVAATALVAAALTALAARVTWPRRGISSLLLLG